MRTAATTLLAALAAGILTVGVAHPTPPATPHLELAHTGGDDNNDGRIDEDESGWRCWVDGNRLCSTVALDGPGAA